MGKAAGDPIRFPSTTITIDRTIIPQTMTTEPSDTTSGVRAFRWDYVVFKVENEIFRVPRHGFINSSPTFKDMYLVGASSRAEGTTDKNPIILEGYTAKDFEALLMVLYPSMGDVENGKFRLTKEQWEGVLKLSRPWGMAKVRQLAIETLSSAPFDLTPTEKVTLAREHKVTSWLLEGLTSLALSEPKLTSCELMESVGLLSAFRIVCIQSESLKPMVSTTTLGGVYAALPVTAVCCTNCYKPYLRDNFACQSCTKVLDSKDTLALYIKTAFTVGDYGMELRAIFNLTNLICRSCNNRAVAHAANCRACAFSVTPANSVFAILGPFSRPASTIEAMVREEFKDEIDDYDA